MHKHFINIYCSHNHNPNISEILPFNQKINIKDDKVTNTNVNDNLTIFSDQEFFLHDGFIFINIDDEINIQSMHTLVFSRMDITLHCCTTGKKIIENLLSI